MGIPDYPTLLVLLAAALLLAAGTGWLSVSAARPLRFWARYPWRVFWGGYVATLAFPPPLHPGAAHAGFLLGAVALLVMYASAVQGLRASWRRSPVGGVLVLAGGFAIGALSSVMRVQHTGQWHRLDWMVFVWFLLIGYWALMAVVADQVARRLEPAAPEAPTAPEVPTAPAG